MKKLLKTQHSKNKYHGIRFHHFMANRGKMETVTDFIFSDSKITADSDFSLEIKRCLLLGRKAMKKPRQCLKKERDVTLPTKVHLIKAMVFPVVIWMWELDHKEGLASKNWCFWTVVLKTLESPLDSKENKQVSPKGNQSWIFTGRTDSEAEVPILWPPNMM